MAQAMELAAQPNYLSRPHAVQSLVRPFLDAIVQAAIDVDEDSAVDLYAYRLVAAMTADPHYTRSVLSLLRP